MATIDAQLDIKKLYDGIVKVAGAGTPANGATAVEYGNEACHKTVITLSSVALPIVSVSTANGVGGLKIYDMPEGHIKILGGSAKLSISVATANQADFTDGTPEGDLGIGTVAPANADALGTDATDDNICTATAFTMSSYADSSVNLPPESDSLLDGSTTPVDIYLNGLVDAADIDDDVSSEILVSGTVTLVWQQLGDY